MFTQLDYTPSKTYNHSTYHWTMIQHLILGTNSGRDEPFFDTIEEDIYRVFAEANSSQRDIRLKEALFINTSPDKIPYFAGYVLVKALRYKLSTIDSRLSDPDVFLSFIHGYFFNDKNLLDFCVPVRDEDFFAREQAIRIRLQNHFQRSLSLLFTCTHERLQEAVDRIVNFDSYKGDYLTFDFAAAIRGDSNVPKTAEEIFQDLIKLIEYDCNGMRQINFGDPDLSPSSREEFNRFIDELMNTTKHYFHCFHLLYNFFKFSRMKSLLIGFQRRNGRIILLSLFPEGRASLIRSFREEDIITLLEEIRNKNFHVIDFNDQKINAITGEFEIDWNVTASYLNEVRSTEESRQCWIEEYDIYDISDQKRLHVFSHGEFIFVAENPIELKNIGLDSKHTEIIKLIEPYFDRQIYLQLLEPVLPSAFSREKWIAPFPGAEEDLLEIVWNTVFPNIRVERNKLGAFLVRKMNWICRGDESQNLLRNLCKDGMTKVSTNDTKTLKNVDMINSRWSDYVDIPLLEVFTLDEHTLQIKMAF